MATRAKRKRKGQKPTRVYARRRDPNADDDTEAPQHTTRWWHADDSMSAVSALWSWVDRQRARWSSDGMMDLIHEAIYRGRPLGGTQANAGNFLLLRSGVLLNLNIIMSMVDTATARLTKRRPMPMISADDAGWSEKLFAKRNSRILRRKMGSSQIERMSPRIIRDMCIRGDGCAKVYRNGGDTATKRIPIYELVIDPFEAEHSETPRQMAHVRPEPRETLIAMYPQHAEAISNAPKYNRNDQRSTYAYAGADLADYVEVAEAWHLPSIPGALDGQHIVTIKGCVLSRKRWIRPRFPIARTQWSAPTTGCGRGSGLVEQLAGIQEQINDILKDAREGLKNGSTLTIFVQRGANVNKHHLRGRHPKVVEFDGVEPHYVAPNPVSEQAIRILLMLIEQAYQITGISQMAAQSKNTLGAGASGKAIDTMDDIQSDRFAHVEADYMQYRCELGQLQVDEAREMYLEAHGKTDDEETAEWDETPDPITKDELAPWIANGKWEKCEIDAGTYHLTIEPVNFLADARGGKLAQVNELGKAGMIPDPAIQADLFDEPDIARANRTILGPKHLLDAIMEGLADVDVPMLELQPDRYMNLPLGILMAKGELNEAMADMMGREDQPEAILERYRQWIESAKGILKGTSAGDGAISPAGMQAMNMGAAPNAMTLQPGLAGAPPGMGPPMGAPQGMAPPGMAA